MKSLMKLLVTILVVAVVGFTVGYLVMNGAKSDSNVQTSGEHLGDSIQNIEGDSVGNERLSGEDGAMAEADAKEKTINMINRQVQAIQYNARMGSAYVKLKRNLVSDNAKEFMDYFKVKELSATIQVSPGCIEVIPDSDFIENMVYYYDGAGNLIMFESVSTTVGGSCKYYYDHGTLIDTVVAYEEEFEVKTENAEEIVSRANTIYAQYSNLRNTESGDTY